METFYKNLSEPWFTFIKNGKKTVEGRINEERYNSYKVGDIIIWKNHEKNKVRSIKTKIVKINKYNTFKEMLKKERLKNTLPNYSSIDTAINEAYYNYYSEEFEKNLKIIIFKLKKI